MPRLSRPWHRHRLRRVVIIGNMGGGKSRLARRLAARLVLPLVEPDALMWRLDWSPAQHHDAAHAAAIARPDWVVEGHR